MSESTPSAPSSRGKRILLYCLGALGTLLFGFDTGNIAGALLYIEGDLGTTPFLNGMIVSSIIVGAIIGAVASGRIADRLGRRRTILIAGVIFFVGALGAAWSVNPAMLIFFRGFLGLAVGASSGIVPVYLAELAPTEVRGALTALHQLMIATGILLGYIVDAALAPWEAWRWMIGLGALPAVILIVGMLFMPETPRWLIKRGREREARAVLQRFRDHSNVDGELEDIKSIDQEERERRETTSLRDLLAPWVRPMLVVGVGLAFFQQATGINTIIYYAPTILTEIGFGDQIALLTNVGLGVWTIAMTFVAIYFVDKVGRKRLLLIGATGLATSMIVLGATSVTTGFTGGAMGWIAVGCLMLFKASFSVGWGAVFGIVISEIFPLNLRGTASGAMWGVQWTSNFAVSLTFPVLLALGSGAVFFIYGAMGVLAFFFALFMVTETKGRSLENIEADLRRKVAVPGGATEAPSRGEGERVR